MSNSIRNRNLTLAPIKSTNETSSSNEMLNLTLAPIKTKNKDVKMIKTEPDANKITYEEEKVALVLGITTIFTLLWMFK